MAASTFAALFLAHVIADYLLQTNWLVENKRRPLAIGLHIAAVLVMMPILTLQISWWFVVLALAHLAIDLIKTHLLGGSLAAYLADQLLHIASILVVVTLAPDLWSGSPLSEVDWIARFYLLLAVFLFAARGGQYAVATYLRLDPEAPGHGVRVGWIERTALAAVVAAGLPWAILGLLAAKVAHLIHAVRHRTAAGRQRFVKGAALSMAWGLGCAAALWVILPAFG